MPLAQTASLPLNMSDILAQMPIKKPMAQEAPVPGPAAGVQQMAPPPDAADPGAAPQPPYTVRLQPDGSSVYEITTGLPPGAPPIIIGVNKPPNLPPALQQPKVPTQ